MCRVTSAALMFLCVATVAIQHILGAISEQKVCVNIILTLKDMHSLNNISTINISCSVDLYLSALC